MAPAPNTRKEKEKKTASTLEFARQLHARLDANVIDASTSKEIASQLSGKVPSPTVANALDYDKIGMALWNVSIQLHHTWTLETHAGLLARLRVFAFYLLDGAPQTLSKQSATPLENTIRIMRTALKTARTCIKDNCLDLCMGVCERAARHVEERKSERGHKRTSAEHQTDEAIMDGLVAEYHLLRSSLAWKQERLGVTEHWLSRIIICSDCEEDAAIAIRKTDLMHEVGKTLLKQNKTNDAAAWLEKAFNTIDAINQESLDQDAEELRRAISSDWIRALTRLKTHESIEKATNLIELLDNEVSFRLGNCMLRLSIIRAQDVVSPQDFYAVLLRSVHGFIVNDTNLKLIMRQTHHLKELDTKLACQILDNLLKRLYESRTGYQSWIEKVLITRVWMTTTSPQGITWLSELQALFEEIYGTTGTPFSPEATHAAQSLMWKFITSSDDSQPSDTAQGWCRLACHPLLQKAGDHNKAVLSRKLIYCALTKSDGPTAREVFFQMSENEKATPATLYLMYRVGLRGGDAEMASEALEGILKVTSKDGNYLYACVLEAQQYGDRQQALAALQKVLVFYDYNAPQAVYLPALLRCTAGMIMTDMKENRTVADVALAEVCNVFEGAKRHTKNFRQSNLSPPNAEEYTAELRWFASQSYNIALKHCADMQPDLLVRFVTACIHFLDLLRQEDRKDKSLLTRLLLCHFLAASALVVLGRSEDGVEQCLQHYLGVRRQTAAFQEVYTGALHTDLLEDAAKADISLKDFELLKYDLEALLKLEQWNDLDRVLEECLQQRHSERWETIADLIIHIHAHIIKAQLDPVFLKKIPAVIEKIINLTWRSSKHDMQKLARWTRCLFKMTMSFDPAMSLTCLDQACAIANNPNLKRPYPADELHWLASTAFNYAVDLYCASNEADSHQWAERAIAIAHAAGQGSGLHQVLQAKWLKLRVNDGS